MVLLFHIYLLFAVLQQTGISHVAAVRLKMRGEPRTPHPATKRDHISGLDNGRNLNYMVNITLGGQQCQVNVDTGSSDLWVAGTVLSANDTGVQSGLTYAMGEVSGAVKTAQLEFSGYIVPEQAFIEVSPSPNTPPVPGMLGLGPNTGSRIHASFNNQPQGDAVLDRVFRQNISAPNYFTVLLGRSEDPAEKYPGDITVSEIISGLENITSQPQVAVTVLSASDAADQHWQVLLDEEGIIGPDGTPIQVQTGVPGAPSPNQLTAIFDTGFTFTQVPQAISDAMYSGIAGASFQYVQGLGSIWIIPCRAEVNLSIAIGGQAYPVHPLDTNSDDAATDGDGNKVCVGTFQPISSGASPNFDIILGMSFLRNAYLLIDFGDLVDGSANTTADPFVQLLSITDPALAHADFVNVRLNNASAAPPSTTFTPPNNTGDEALIASAPSSSHSTVKSSFLKEKIPIIVASSVGAALVLIGTLVLYRTRSRIAKRGRNSLANTYRSYQRLEAPAPAGEMRQVRAYHSHPRYPNGWGQR
ncbi:aspartic peptidase domain-containing protein [Gloeopeniophorella convolvens]|nr:aspartic peptidase domain-containing protein [Gloeopeniophorella convolvens]